MIKKWIATLLLLIVHAGFRAFSQYAIIPKPLEIQLGSDQFTFSLNYSLECNSTDLNLQKTFKDWVQQEAIKKVKANKMVQTKLSLLWVGPKKWQSFLKKLRLRENFDPGEEGYVLLIEKNSIMVLAPSNAGLFYGFQSLQQLFKQDQILCGEIYDKPSFAVRAWQDDISRGPIPTLEQLKKEIKVLSHYKLNYFTLYTEHVFKYVRYPGIAPKEGLRAEEITELAAFAKLHYVHLIANQQSFGHLEKLLSTPGYEDLAENKHIISPANERTYTLFKNFYEEQHSAYKSKYFHINADETFGLGLGKTKGMADSLGIAKLYAYHINKLHHLLQLQGNTLLMWSDMVAAHPEIIQYLPKDIVLVPWAYDGSQSFEKFLTPIAKSGFTFWVAPGINNWLNLYPNQQATQENIYNLVRDGFSMGAKGVLNTSWDDDGFALFGNNWQGFIWGADLSWNAPADESNSSSRWQKFEKDLDIQFWEGAMQKWVAELAQLHQTSVLNPLRNETLFEPLFPFYPAYISKEKEAACIIQAEKLNKIMEGIASVKMNSLQGKEALSYLLFSLHAAKFNCEKNKFRYWFAQAENRILYPNKTIELIQALETQCKHLQNEFNALYVQENRPYYLKENNQKFESFLHHLKQLPYYFEIKANEKISRKGRKFWFEVQQKNHTVRYTWGKSILEMGSTSYKKPFYSKHNLHIKAGIYQNGSLQFYKEDSFLYHEAIGSVEHINLQPSKYHPSYVSSGKMALVDGKIGSEKDLKSGLWQGYSGANLQIDLTLNHAPKTQSFAMGFYQNTPSWVLLPSKIEIYISENGIQYQLFKTIEHQISIDREDAFKHIFSAQWPKQKMRYMRIIAVYAGKLPPNHAGAGQASMMFADEIILK